MFSQSVSPRIQSSQSVQSVQSSQSVQSVFYICSQVSQSVSHVTNTVNEQSVTNRNITHSLTVNSLTHSLNQTLLNPINQSNTITHYLVQFTLSFFTFEPPSTLAETLQVCTIVIFHIGVTNSYILLANTRVLNTNTNRNMYSLLAFTNIKCYHETVVCFFRRTNIHH